MSRLAERRWSVRTFVRLPRARILAGRIFLLLGAVALLVSPLTEQIWTWDRFLWGGQDFELSLMALITFLCLMLVFAHHFRRVIASLLELRSFSSRLRARSQVRSRRSYSSWFILDTGRSTAPVFGTYRILLQI